MHVKATLKRMESIEFGRKGYILGECRALSGSPGKVMKCMTMLGDVGNALARYLQHLMFQDEQLLLEHQGV